MDLIYDTFEHFLLWFLFDFHHMLPDGGLSLKVAPITSADEIKRELLAQVCGTVQWKDTIDYMVGSGVSDFLEIGPGRALAGMVKRIDRRAKIANVADLDSIIDLRRN